MPGNLAQPVASESSLRFRPSMLLNGQVFDISVAAIETEKWLGEIKFSFWLELLECAVV